MASRQRLEHDLLHFPCFEKAGLYCCKKGCTQNLTCYLLCFYNTSQSYCFHFAASSVCDKTVLQAFQAVREDDVDTLSCLIRLGTPVDCENNNGDSLIMAASIHHAHKCMQLLISSHVDVKTTSSNGHTVLTRLCSEDDVFDTEINMLVCASAEVNKSNALSDTPIFLATYNNNLTNMRCLIAHKALVNKAVQYGDLPLIAAVRNGHIDAARELIHSGADVNMCNWFDVTPLLATLQMCKHRRDREQLFYLLVNANADTAWHCFDGTSPFLQCICNHDVVLLRYLLDNGHKLQTTNYRGRSAEERVTLALDMSCPTVATGKINELFFGSGETCNTARIFNKHAIIHYMERDTKCIDLQSICRRNIRALLLKNSTTNLVHQVNRLALPQRIAHYMLFWV